MRAAARYPAVVQHINFVRILYGRKAVRDDEKRFAPDDFGDRLFHLLLIFGIGERRCLVQNDDGRVFKDRPCERHPLPLPARKRAAAVACKRINTVFQPINKFHTLCFLRRGKYFFLRRVWPPDLDIVVNAGVEQEIILRHKGNFIVQCIEAHVRNVLYTGDHQFHESSHVSHTGSLDLYEIMKALIEVGFNGLIRPDHGREIWDEIARPGYGLYDRALGATYLIGLEEAIRKSKGEAYPNDINSVTAKI